MAYGGNDTEDIWKNFSSSNGVQWNCLPTPDPRITSGPWNDFSYSDKNSWNISSTATHATIDDGHGSDNDGFNIKHEPWPAAPMIAIPTVKPTIIDKDDGPWNKRAISSDDACLPAPTPTILTEKPATTNGDDGPWNKHAISNNEPWLRGKAISTEKPETTNGGDRLWNKHAFSNDEPWLREKAIPTEKPATTNGDDGPWNAVSNNEPYLCAPRSMIPTVKPVTMDEYDRSWNSRPVSKNELWQPSPAPMTATAMSDTANRGGGSRNKQSNLNNKQWQHASQPTGAIDMPAATYQGNETSNNRSRFNIDTWKPAPKTMHPTTFAVAPKAAVSRNGSIVVYNEAKWRAETYMWCPGRQRNSPSQLTDSEYRKIKSVSLTICKEDGNVVFDQIIHEISTKMPNAILTELVICEGSQITILDIRSNSHSLKNLLRLQLCDLFSLTLTIRNFIKPSSVENCGESPVLRFAELFKFAYRNLVHIHLSNSPGSTKHDCSWLYSFTYDNFFNFELLEYLQLSDCSTATGQSLMSICNRCRNLKTLILCKAFEITDSGLRIISFMERLEMLQIMEQSHISRVGFVWFSLQFRGWKLWIDPFSSQEFEF